MLTKLTQKDRELLGDIIKATIDTNTHYAKNMTPEQIATDLLEAFAPIIKVFDEAHEVLLLEVNFLKREYYTHSEWDKYEIVVKLLEKLDVNIMLDYN